MLSINNVIKIFLLTFVMSESLFSEINKNKNVLLFALQNTKKSYDDLENMYNECEKKRKENIIEDFNFSKMLMENNISFDKLITLYDIKRQHECIKNKENSFFMNIYIFNKVKEEYNVKDIVLPHNIISAYQTYQVAMHAPLEMEYYFYEYNKKLSNETHLYLDKKLGKLFDGRKLRDAYKAYLEKKKKK